MSENASVFRPDAVTIKLGEETFTLKYDLNAFQEMEKIYESVDSVIQMVLGATPVPDLEKLMYDGKLVAARDITIGDITLEEYITKLTKAKESKYADTLNLLWIGCLHAYTEYDQFGEIVRYTLPKAKLGALVTFKNVREVNNAILKAFLSDLFASDKEKNADAPEVQEQQQPQLTLKK
jgi:hypothetical protein